jgi:hypothetical protein
MPGIGKSDYPELTPTKAFEIVERVGRESVKTGNGLASVMGLKSPDSGYFYHQVSSLTKYYGLIDRTKGAVALTALGERIAHPLSEEDKRLAQGEAVRRVSLITSLFERLGAEFHEADFRTTLRDVTQAPLAEIEKSANEVEALYKDAQRYLTNSGQGRSTTERSDSATTKPGLDSHGTQRSEAVLAHESGYRTFQADGVFLKIKKDKESLEEALATIQGWLKRHARPDESTR